MDDAEPRKSTSVECAEDVLEGGSHVLIRNSKIRACTVHGLSIAQIFAAALHRWATWRLNLRCPADDAIISNLATAHSIPRPDCGACRVQIR
jgi:hypothetical protein